MIMWILILVKQHRFISILSKFILLYISVHAIYFCSHKGSHLLICPPLSLVQYYLLAYSPTSYRSETMVSTWSNCQIVTSCVAWRMPSVLANPACWRILVRNSTLRWNPSCWSRPLNSLAALLSSWEMPSFRTTRTSSSTSPPNYPTPTTHLRPPPRSPSSTSHSLQGQCKHSWQWLQINVKASHFITHSICSKAYSWLVM